MNLLLDTVLDREVIFTKLFICNLQVLLKKVMVDMNSTLPVGLFLMMKRHDQNDKSFLTCFLNLERKSRKTMIIMHEFV